MNEAQMIRRVLLLTCLAFVAVMAALVAASLFIVTGLDNEPTASSTVGYVLAGVVGAGGVAAAVVFRNRVVEQTISPDRLRTRYFVTTAIAEMGMLLGFAWSFVSHEFGPLFLGSGLFLAALGLIAHAVANADIIESV